MLREKYRELTQSVRFNCGHARKVEFMTLHLSFEGYLGIHFLFKGENNISDSGSNTHR